MAAGTDCRIEKEFISLDYIPSIIEGECGSFLVGMSVAEFPPIRTFLPAEPILLDVGKHVPAGIMSLMVTQLKDDPVQGEENLVKV